MKSKRLLAVPMPEKNKVIPVDFTLSAEDAGVAMKGIYFRDMDDKWASYFEDSSMFCVRTWSGTTVFKISFLPNDGGGLKAVSAAVNADPEQYGGADDATSDSICLVVEQLIEQAKNTEYRRIVSENGTAYGRWLTPEQAAILDAKKAVTA